MSKKLGTALFICLVVACAPAKKAPKINLAGYPPEFRAGYLDGCNSADRQARKTRDDARFRNDPQYALGWRDGFDICSKQKN